MSKGCLWSLLLLSVDEGECEEYFSFWSRRKTVRKHYMRPPTPHQARSQCWIPPGTPHSQRLLTGLRGLRVGLLMLLFWFLPRPGTVAIHDSCILALRWLWPLFISAFFFFSMNFLLFFQIQYMDESGVIVSKFPGPAQGQEPVVQD